MLVLCKIRLNVSYIQRKVDESELKRIKKERLQDQVRDFGCSTWPDLMWKMHGMSLEMLW